MTVAEICVTAYLIVGGLATVLIWSALAASKRRIHNSRNVHYHSLRYNPFREPNTKPSRLHP